jgi:hypothetical protein
MFPYGEYVRESFENECLASIWRVSCGQSRTAAQYPRQQGAGSRPNRRTAAQISGRKAVRRRSGRGIAAHAHSPTLLSPLPTHTHTHTHTHHYLQRESREREREIERERLTHTHTHTCTPKPPATVVTLAPASRAAIKRAFSAASTICSVQASANNSDPNWSSLENLKSSW